MPESGNFFKIWLVFGPGYYFPILSSELRSKWKHIVKFVQSLFEKLADLRSHSNTELKTELFQWQKLKQIMLWFFGAWYNYISVIKIAIGHGTLYNWKKTLSKLKLENYQKCPTVLSREIVEKDLIFLVELNFNFKYDTIYAKVGPFLIVFVALGKTHV